MNLLKEFQQVQIIYGVYNRGKALLQPRVVTIADNVETLFLRNDMGIAMHDIQHMVKDIEAHPDTMLIFEIHVKPKINDEPPPKPPMARGPHNGYPLSR